MSPTIVLFEHQSYPYEELGLDAQHPVIELLEAANQEAGVELLRLERKRIKANSYVGFISVGEWTFQILPKLDYDQRGNHAAPYTTEPYTIAAQSAAKNLIVLLSYVYNLKIHEQNTALQEMYSGNWFELLTYLFATDLHRQVQTGMQHAYQNIEETLPVLRGRWDFNRQITQNFHNRHLFNVIHDEYSSNTILNQIFRFVIERLAPITHNQLTQILLADLNNWFNEVQRLNKITPELLAGITFNRLNQQFEPAFNFARLFLESQILQSSSGDKHLYAFLFDMNRLFEQFIGQFLQIHQRQILPEEWAEAVFSLQATGKQKYLAEKLSGNEKVFLLKPDIIIKPRFIDQPYTIIDVKYKILDPAQRRLGVAEEDIYQMLAYALGFDTSRILLIYPQPAWMNAPLREVFIIPDQNIAVQVATINMCTPLDNSNALIVELNLIFNQYSLKIAAGGNHASV